MYLNSYYKGDYMKLKSMVKVVKNIKRDILQPASYGRKSSLQRGVENMKMRLKKFFIKLAIVTSLLWMSSILVDMYAEKEVERYRLKVNAQTEVQTQKVNEPEKLPDTVIDTTLESKRIEKGIPPPPTKSGEIVGSMAVPTIPLAQQIEKKNPVFERDEIIRRINGDARGKLSGMGSAFYDISKKWSLNPYLVYSISNHETGNGTSAAVRNKNNVGGLMSNSDRLLSYPTIQMSIEHMCKVLKTYYIDQGLDSVDKIQKKYCPINAANDKGTNLNRFWFAGVWGNYQRITKGPASTSPNANNN
jgi:hypothetical protein